MLKEIEYEMNTLSEEIHFNMCNKAWIVAIKDYERIREHFLEAKLNSQATLTLVSIASLLETIGQVEKAGNIMLSAANEFEEHRKMGYAFKAYQRALDLMISCDQIGKVKNIQQKIESLGMLDLVIVIDSTGSMGSGLDSIRKEIAKMLYKMSDKIPGIRIGALTYRDHCNENTSYLIKAQPFIEQVSSEIAKLVSFVDSWVPDGGGGDGGEAVADALDYLQKGYEWESVKKISILIADEPPHPPEKCPNKLDWKKISAKLANDEIKVYSVICGNDVRTIESFKEIARITESKSFLLSDTADLPDLIVAIALHQFDLAEDFIIDIESEGKLTESKRELLKELI